MTLTALSWEQTLNWPVPLQIQRGLNHPSWCLSLLLVHQNEENIFPLLLGQPGLLVNTMFLQDAAVMVGRPLCHRQPFLARAARQPALRGKAESRERGLHGSGWWWVDRVGAGPNNPAPPTPSHLLTIPLQFSLIANQLLTTAGSMNCTIVWLRVGGVAGAGGTGRTGRGEAG